MPKSVFLFLLGQSFLVLMCSDGFVHIYSLPELKLVFRADCVDASDAFGQRNFCVTSCGLFIHLRSPSEFSRGSLTEQARLNSQFSLSSKPESPPAAVSLAKSLSKSREGICVVSQVEIN